MEKQKKLSVMLLFVLSLSFILAISDTVYLDDYEITYSYSGAEEDDIFTLRVEINNTGSAKSNVIFEIDEEDPFSLDSDSEWVIGSIAEDEQVSNSFRVEVDGGTDEGTYDLPFSLEDSDDNYDDEFEIEVDSDVADLVIGGISSMPSQIVADQKDIKLEVTIENIGGGDANYVKARLELPQGFEKSDSYSDFVNLGSINSGDSKTATFYINTLKNVDGQNFGSVLLDYKSDSDRKADRLSIDLPVKGKPSFAIFSSGVFPEKVFAADSGELKLSISNQGEEEGQETSIRIFENTDIPIEFLEKTKFVGDLDVGETGSAVFSFDVKSDAPANRYLVKVQVRTVDSDSVLTEEFNVPITVYEEESNPLKTLLISFFVLIVLLMGTLIYFRIRK